MRTEPENQMGEELQRPASNGGTGHLALWEALLDASSDALLLLDADRTILAFNSTFRAVVFSFWKQDVLVGQNITPLLDQYQARQFFGPALAIGPDEESNSYEATINSQDTELLWEVACFRQPEGQLVVALRDRSEVAQLKQQLAIARQGSEAAMQLNEALTTQFLLTYQPTLRAASSFGWWLLQHLVPILPAEFKTDGQELADALMSNGYRLERLLGIFLVASDLLKEKLIMRPGRYMLKRQLSMLERSIQGIMNERQGSLNMKLELEPPVFLSYDYGALSLILNCLLGLAVAGSPGAAITMGIRVHEETEEDLNLHFYVLDPNPLTEEDVKLILSEHFIGQLDKFPPLMRYHALGVHYALQVVKAWGGKLSWNAWLRAPEARTELKPIGKHTLPDDQKGNTNGNAGSRWDLWLNFQKVASSSLLVSNTGSTMLLVAPANMQYQKLWRDLQYAGVELEHVSKLEQVGSKLMSRTYKAVLLWMDWDTGGHKMTQPKRGKQNIMDYVIGWRRLLTDQRMVQPTWISLIRMPDAIWQDQLTRLGFKACFSLPADTEALLQLLQLVQNQDDFDDIILPSYLDKSFMNSVAGDNQAFVMDLMRLFLDGSPQAVRELEQLLVTGDYAQCAAVIHKLKSNLKLMGLVEVAEAAEELEGQYLKGVLARHHDDMLLKFKKQMAGAQQHYRLELNKLMAIMRTE